MNVITGQDPAVAWAEQLWERLQRDFLDAQNTIIAIIDSRAWEPLGYESFAKAWVDKMSNITLAVEIRPHVVYQMMSEGMTSEQIADAVKGLGLKGAEVLKRQRDNGVPPEFATPTDVRKPLPYATLFIKVPREQLKAWNRIAKRHDAKVSEIAYTAIESAFTHLDNAE